MKIVIEGIIKMIEQMIVLLPIAIIVIIVLLLITPKKYKRLFWKSFR